MMNETTYKKGRAEMPTKIEWTGPNGETWNPVTGCTKISAGCKHCYAARMTPRLKAMGQEKYAAGFDEVVCHWDELERPLRWRKPSKLLGHGMILTDSPPT